MATKSFSYGQRLAICSLLIFTACSSLKTRKESDTSAPAQPAGPANPMVTDAKSAAPAIEAPPATSAKPQVKLGLILGPGAIKSFAHIGVLKELVRAQIPVHAIVGLEWGAVMGGIFAQHGQGNEVEWKAFRLREEEWASSQLLGKRIKMRSTNDLKGFLEVANANSEIQSLDLRFTCPAYNPRTGKVLWFQRGRLSDITARCLSYPPLYRHAEDIYGFANGVVDAAQQLRRMGATFVILVQVLQPPFLPKELNDEHFADNILWEEVRRDLTKPKLEGIDWTLNVDTSSFDMIGFDQRRGLMEAGQKASSSLLRRLNTEFGF